MYQDPHNQGRARGSDNQNPDNQMSRSGHWQDAMDRAQSYWSRLTEEDVRRSRDGRTALINVLQERYGFSCTEADRHIEEFLLQLAQPRGWFERLSAMNGSLPINQYVSNPAPGPSTRDDQPPSVLPPDADAHD